MPDLVWTTGGDAGMLAHAFPAARIIVQCVDIYEAYSGPSIVEVELADYRSADHVVSIGHALRRFLVEKRGVSYNRTTVIGQGADNALFARIQDVPEILSDLPRPRLVWAGLLNKADPGLMSAALNSLPNAQGSMILIGPPAPWSEALAANDRRVVALGPQPAEFVAAALKASDIGLMLYDRSRPAMQYLGQNPLKLFEMAAAGLPIISTPHAEYAEAPPPAIVVSTEAEVARALDMALRDSMSLRQAGLRFAAANDWGVRFQEAEALVDALLRQGPRNDAKHAQRV